MPRILFVCLGNICRSPAAEGVMRTLAPDWSIDSAGTSGFHNGEPPTLEMQQLAASHGHDLTRLRSRKFTAADFGQWDEIVVMDESNKRNVETLRPEGDATPVTLFLSYAPDQPVREVPDPYYTGDYPEALGLIEAAAKGLYQAYQTRD